MSATYYSENLLLKRLFGSVTLTPPSNWHIALFTGTGPTEALGGGTEVSGTGYARVSVPNTITYWNDPSYGLLTNKLAIVFPEALGSWGNITYVGFYDTAIGGASNLWFYEALTSAKTVDTGTTVQFTAATLTISARNT